MPLPFFVSTSPEEKVAMLYVLVPIAFVYLFCVAVEVAQVLGLVPYTHNKKKGV